MRWLKRWVMRKLKKKAIALLKKEALAFVNSIDHKDIDLLDGKVDQWVMDLIPPHMDWIERLVLTLEDILKDSLKEWLPEIKEWVRWQIKEFKP